GAQRRRRRLPNVQNVLVARLVEHDGAHAVTSFNCRRRLRRRRSVFRVPRSAYRGTSCVTQRGTGTQPPHGPQPGTAAQPAFRHGTRNGGEAALKHGRVSGRLLPTDSPPAAARTRRGTRACAAPWGGA